MSSLGGQWRVIRHYLSLSNLNAEVEKLVQRIKPASPEQWDSLIRRFEKAVTARIAPAPDVVKTDNNSTVNATAIEQTDSKLDSNVQSESKQKEVPASPTGPPPGLVSETKELTVESLLQGLRLKKDTQLGKISEPTWKETRHTVTKARYCEECRVLVVGKSGQRPRAAVTGG